MQGSFEAELRDPFEAELHGSLATWPSRLSGFLRAELHGPFETELHGSLEQSYMAPWLLSLMGCQVL